MIITLDVLNRWAATERARRTLPELMRRLVHETTPKWCGSTFPTGDPARHKGFDGITFVERGTEWVPEGITVWEMSCREDVDAKVKDDFERRMRNASEEFKAEHTFMFATPRTWEKKDDWATSSREGTGWKDVRALDGTRILDWLKDGWVSEVWLAEQVNENLSEFQTPDRWWNRWTNATQPRIPTELVLARHGNPASQLLKMLDDPNTARIVISGESRDEAIAFVIATLLDSRRWDILDRSIVVPDTKQSIPMAQGVKRILIVDEDDGELPAIGTKGFVTVHPVHHGKQFGEPNIVLSYISSRKFYEVLEKNKIEPATAWRKTHDAGCSLMVYRRLHAREEAFRWPAWTRNVETGGTLVAAILAGAWNEAGWEDGNMLAKFAEVTEEEWLRAVEPVTGVEDAPITRYGYVLIVASPVEALHLLQGKFTKALLDRFYTLALEVLGERDPAQDLEEHEQRLAVPLGKTRKYSDDLADGIGTSLCLLSVFGNQICGSELGEDLPCRNKELVQQLMSGCTGEEWYSRRKYLRLLAECDPEAFLGCLEVELDLKEPNIRRIMGSIEDVGLGECMRQDLLWALESLAEDPQYYTRVAVALANLVSLEPYDNYETKSQNSLRALFHPERMTAGIPLKLMQATLTALFEQSRLAALDVCLVVWSGKIHRYRLTRSHFRWRRIASGVADGNSLSGEIMLQADEEIQVKTLTDRMLVKADRLDSSELSRIVKDFHNLSVGAQRWVVRQAKLWQSNATDVDCAEMWDMVEHSISCLQPATVEGESTVRRFRKISRAVMPRELGNRHKWLFKDYYIRPERFSRVPRDIQARYTYGEQALLKARDEAITQIWSSGVVDALLDFVGKVKCPDIVGTIVANSEQLSEERCDIAVQALTVRSSNCKATLFLQGLFRSMEGLNVFLDIAIRKLLNQDQMCQLVECLPGTPGGWFVAESCGDRIASTYWSTVGIERAQYNDEELSHCLDKLLEADRPARAAWVGVLNIRKVPGTTWVDILSRAIEQEVQSLAKERLEIDRYEATKIFLWLDECEEVPTSSITNLEIAFLKQLTDWINCGGEPQRELTLHRMMARDPKIFVDLLKATYGNRSDGVESFGSVNLAEDQLQDRMRAAWMVLRGWSMIPGMNSDNTIDRDEFIGWNREVLCLAKLYGLQYQAEHKIGQLLASCVATGKITFNQPWVCNFLETEVTSCTLDSFADALYRGPEFSFRELFAGGDPDRTEVESLQQMVFRLEPKCPKLAQALRRTMDLLLVRAEALDNQRALFERRHG